MHGGWKWGEERGVLASEKLECVLSKYFTRLTILARFIDNLLILLKGKFN